MNINISIADKRPTVYSSPVIICGNSDYVITFLFDEEWRELNNKVARFTYTRDGREYFQDEPFTGNVVNVPILSDISEVRIGVYAGNLCTTTPARIPCQRSILCGDAVEQISPEEKASLEARVDALEKNGGGTTSQPGTGSGGTSLPGEDNSGSIPPTTGSGGTGGGFVAQATAPDNTALLWIDTDDNGESGAPSGGDSGGLNITNTATVGQTIQVAAVDDTGKPTAWTAVDFPSGGGSGKWEVIADVTTTEEVSQVTVDKDINGNSYALKKFRYSIVVVSTDTNTANKELQVWGRQQGEYSVRYAYTNDMVRPGNFASRLEVSGDTDMRSIKQMNSYFYANNKTSWPTSIMGNCFAYESGKATQAHSPWIFFDAKTSGVFGVGTRIILLGVRA